jgi:hypothetical protein
MYLMSWRMVDFRQLPGVPCPCGTARRAFADGAEFPGTVAHFSGIAVANGRIYVTTFDSTFYSFGFPVE